MTSATQAESANAQHNQEDELDENGDANQYHQRISSFDLKSHMPMHSATEIRSSENLVAQEEQPFARVDSEA